MPPASDLYRTVALPPLSCDSHIHVFGAPAQYPGAPTRQYQPSPMPLEGYRPGARRLGLERMVLVQPSAYGADNRCLLDTLAQQGGAHARGIAVIDAAIARQELQAMHGVGVRGVRLNLMNPRVSSTAAAERMLFAVESRIAELGWHIQIYADPAVVAPLSAVLRRLSVPVVLDHMAGVRAEIGRGDRHFVALLHLLAEGACWIKLSGADIVTGRDRGFTDAAAPFVQALVEANPDRLVWGSDWPHLVHVHGAMGDAAPEAAYRSVDELELLMLLRACANEATLQRILVANPQRLYGF